MRSGAVLAGVVLMLATACGDDGDGSNGEQQRSASPLPTITVSPVDPAHVTAVSKFRSCSGHDFSPGAKGKGSPDDERARSMKHYLKTDITLTPAGQVQIYAPFDGTIDIQAETFALGMLVFVTSGDWSARIFHIDPSVADGATVKAGDMIVARQHRNARSLSLSGDWESFLDTVWRPTRSPPRRRGLCASLAPCWRMTPGGTEQL